MKKIVNIICTVVSVIFIIIGLVYLDDVGPTHYNIDYILLTLTNAIISIGFISLGTFGLLLQVYFINKNQEK